MMDHEDDATDQRDLIIDRVQKERSSNSDDIESHRTRKLRVQKWVFKKKILLKLFFLMIQIKRNTWRDA